MATNKSKPLPGLSASDIARFWSFVDKTPGQGPKGECWGWKGAKFPGGYGALQIKGRPVRAHRIAWFLAHGKDPYPWGVLHSCDNGPCSNPKHLYLGDDEINIGHASERGRLSTGDQHFTHKNPGCRVGVKNGNSKLTEEKVMEIRKFHQDHSELSQRKIAKHFCVARSHLYSILYSTWKHLPGEPLGKRGAGHNKSRKPAPNQATGRTHPPQ